MEVLSVAAVAVTPVPGLTGCIRPHQPRPLPWPETRPRQGLAGAAMVVEMAAARPATPPSPPPPPPPFAATLAAALPHCYGATEKEKMSILSNGREGGRLPGSLFYERGNGAAIRELFHLFNKGEHGGTLSQSQYTQFCQVTEARHRNPGPGCDDTRWAEDCRLLGVAEPAKGMPLCCFVKLCDPLSPSSPAPIPPAPPQPRPLRHSLRVARILTCRCAQLHADALHDALRQRLGRAADGQGGPRHAQAVAVAHRHAKGNKPCPRELAAYP